MNDNFKVGDTVYLKTGHTPALSIFQINEDRAQCSWFKDGKLEKEIFHLNQLTKEPPTIITTH